MLEYKHFLTFHTLYETKNSRATTEKLQISRQTLSNIINYIEEETGQTIVLRNTSPLRFTPFGEYLYQCACRILSSYNDEIHRLTHYTEPTLSIALFNELMGIFPDIRTVMLHYQKKNPSPQLEIAYHNNQMKILEAVKSGVSSCGLILAATNSKFDDCWSIAICKRPLFAVVAQNHPLASQHEVTLSQISRYSSFFFCDAITFLPDLYSAYTSSTGNKVNLIIDSNLMRTSLRMIQDNTLIRISMATEITNLNKSDVAVIPIRDLDVSLQIIGYNNDTNKELCKNFAKFLYSEQKYF